MNALQNLDNEEKPTFIEYPRTSVMRHHRKIVDVVWNVLMMTYNYDAICFGSFTKLNVTIIPADPQLYNNRHC